MGVLAETGRPEAALPLIRTASGDLGVSAAGLPVVVQPQLHFHNAPPVKQTQQHDGGQRLDVIFDEMVANSLRSGTLRSRVLQQRYGVRRQAERIG